MLKVFSSAPDGASGVAYSTVHAQIVKIKKPRSGTEALRQGMHGLSRPRLRTAADTVVLVAGASRTFTVTPKREKVNLKNKKIICRD